MLVSGSTTCLCQLRARVNYAQLQLWGLHRSTGLPLAQSSVTKRLCIPWPLVTPAHCACSSCCVYLLSGLTQLNKFPLSLLGPLDAPVTESSRHYTVVCIDCSLWAAAQQAGADILSFGNLAAQHSQEVELLHPQSHVDETSQPMP